MSWSREPGPRARELAKTILVESRGEGSSDSASLVAEVIDWAEMSCQEEERKGGKLVSSTLVELSPPSSLPRARTSSPMASQTLTVAFSS